jgi:N-acetylmuramic acid 6-phosphate (MurNAc-6-P) etherase
MAALDATKLVKVGGGVQQLFIYQTPDTNAEVVTSGYFNDVTNQLRQHDIILVVSASGGTPKVDPISVTSATGAATVTTTVTET